MKKLLVLLMVFLVIPFGLAETELVDAGITPDSAVYNWDVFFDNIMLKLQFTEQARAEKNLEIAEERLAETQEMLMNGDSESAEKSQLQYQYRMQGLETALGNVENEVAINRIQSRIEAHEQKVAQVQEQFQEQDGEGIMNQIQNRFQEANVVAEERATQLQQGNGGNSE